MKQLQNNFTTPEQSKKLLDLGLPVNSADCYITQNKNNSSKLKEIYILKRNYSALLAHYNEMAQKEEMYISITPCWSVGRLIEIYGILRGVTCIFSLNTTDIIDDIIDCFERNKLDFSKLEE